MKGIIFTGLLEMVEEKYGYVVANNIIVKSALPSGGIYTSVGTYDYGEMHTMLKQLAVETGLSGSELLENYGCYYFEKLAKKAIGLFTFSDGLLSFLSKIESYIHPEVLKLYPDAQLPIMSVKEHTGNSLILIYQSPRKMEFFALGLIKGAIAYFGEKAEVTMHSPSDTSIEFKIVKL